MIAIDERLLFDGRLLKLGDSAQLLFLRANAFAAMLKLDPLRLTMPQFGLLAQGLTGTGDDGYPQQADERDIEMMVQSLINVELIVDRTGDADNVEYVLDQSLVTFIDDEGDEQSRHERPNLNLWPEAVEAGR